MIAGFVIIAIGIVVLIGLGGLLVYLQCRRILKNREKINRMTNEVIRQVRER